MPVMRVNSVDLNYAETGAGEAIVMLHGYTGSHRDWASQMAFLSDRYRMIAPDQRGHGASEAPSKEEDYTIEIFRDDLFALLEKIGVDRCSLIGHSLGGFVALQFALDHPGFVSGLVLVDTSSGDFERVPGYERLRQQLDYLARNEGLEAAFEYDAANNPVRIERFQRHPERREVARQKVLNTSVDGYIYAARAIGKWRPVTSRLGEISVPTVIFWGEEDAPFQRASQTLKDSIRGSELVVVPGAGHSPHEEVREFFNGVLEDFLSRVAGRQ